jgi:YegS/Rv2252/BmrU family lipid kinase
MPDEQAPVTRLLIVSRNAGSFTPEVEAKLVTAFPKFPIIDFNPKKDFRKLLTPNATVVVAGGDGTIGFVARALAGSRKRLGILSLGTFNNFARGLGLPEDIDKAIKVVLTGRARRVKLGRVDDEPFLEIAAIGMFGEVIELGEKAKDRHLAEVPAKLRAVAGARPFEYTISGDIDGRGRALSLVFSNTPTTGAQMSVGEARPVDPTLDLAIHVGASRSDVVGRVLASTFLDKHVDDKGMSFRLRRVRVETKPRVAVFADNMKAGRTPVTISVDPRALLVILPPATSARGAKPGRP